MSIQRYKRVGLDARFIPDYVPSGASVSRTNDETFVDVNLTADAELPELTAWMDSQGYEFIGTTPSATQLDIYVDPTGGSDSNPGTSGSPIQTDAEADRRIPVDVEQPTLIHKRADTYAAHRYKPRNLSAPLLHVADDTWDSSAYTEVATGTSGGGTGAGVVVDSVGGLAVNVYQGQGIEMTSGAANGQRRTVRNNTATDIIPSAPFNPAPASGDTYRIIETAVIYDLDALEAAHGAIPMTAGSVLGVPSVQGFVDQPALFGFIGINFQGTERVMRFSADTALYGCVSNVSPPLAPIVQIASALVDGSVLWAGCDSARRRADLPKLFGAADEQAWLGWGLRDTQALGRVDLRSGMLVGYLETAGFMTPGDQQGADLLIFGGHLNGFTAGRGCRAKFFGDTVVPLIDGSLSSSSGSLNVQEGASVQLVAAEVLASAGNLAIRVLDDGILELNSAVTGETASSGTSILVQGGRVRLNGAPNFGRAAPDTDWDVDNGSPQDKSFFGSVGDAMTNLVDVGAIVRSS